MPSDPPSIFGRRFREARLSAGLTQQDIERMTDITQHYISTMERGKENPTLETMTRLAEAVGQSLIELLRP
jgi:transcriptional regulator with XRE-family HTH domain